MRSKTVVALAFVFRAGYIESWGRGIEKILRACREHGNRPPIYDFGMAGLMLTFRANPAHLQDATLGQDRGTLTPHVGTGEVTGEVTPQVTPHVTPHVERLLMVLQGAMDREQLQTALDLKDRMSFHERYLRPALEAGLIRMTIPEKPKSRQQRYRLTAAGEAHRAANRQKGPPP